MTTSLTPDARQALRDAADAHAGTAQSLHTAAASMEALRSSVDAAVNLNLRASSALARAADALEPGTGDA